jgi:hypothetical protein
LTPAGIKVLANASKALMIASPFPRMKPLNATRASEPAVDDEGPSTVARLVSRTRQTRAQSAAHPVRHGEWASN